MQNAGMANEVIEKLSASQEAYINAVVKHSRAAVNVLVTRSKEPYRVEEALRHYGVYNAIPVHTWNIVEGWTTYQVGKDPVKNKMLDPIKALKWISDMDNGGENHQRGIFIIETLDQAFEKTNTVVNKIITKYSRDFAERDAQVVFSVGEVCPIPSAIQNFVTLVDMELPKFDEIEDAYRVGYGSFFGADVRDEEIPYFNDEQIKVLANSASGMTTLEAEAAMSLAVVDQHPNSNTDPQELDFDTFNEFILEQKTEVVRRSEVLELMKSGSLEDIGGLDLLKEWIANKKFAFSKEAREYGVDKPKGCAFIGSAGTGKSVSAKAIASELGLPLIKFDISKVFGSLVGQTEEKTRSALKQIEAISPCVVLVDEIDKAGLDDKGTQGDGGVTQRVLGALLTFMQETEKEVFWVFTLNKPKVATALTRKGRLDEIFAVLPPNKIERAEIIKIHVEKRGHSVAGIDMDAVVKATKGFVGAEIEAIIGEAIAEAFRESKKTVGTVHIVRQAGLTRPMSVTHADDHEEMVECAKEMARPASSPDVEEDQTKTQTSETPKRPRRRMNKL